MTISAQDGPLITVGWEAPLGSATNTVGVTGATGPYISGKGPNPDAGPNVFYSGSSMKDPLYRYAEGGGSLKVGGYPNQALGFIDNNIFTADITPSAIATANIAALVAPTISVPLPLVSVSGAGITVISTAIVVLNSGAVVPAGVVQIDAAPAWNSFGDSGAIRGWSGAAVGRAVSLTSGSNLSAINFTIRGYDLYGRPQSEVLVGPNISTVSSVKTYKWLLSVTPSNTSVNTVSVGTADKFGFPMRVDKWSNVILYWDNTLITASTGLVAADTTNPATISTGDPRGTYATQSASDGTRQLQIYQRLGPNKLSTYPPALGIFGPVPA